MASRNLIYTVRPALGGLDITSDPSILDPNYLVTADNITFLEGGQRKRRPGMLQYSASSSLAGTLTNAMVSSARSVRALSDTWDYSSGGEPIQRLVAVTNRSIFRSTGNGLWAPLSATSSWGVGSNDRLRANIMLGQDHAVLSDGLQQPVAYNLAATTLVNPTTGSNWPIFEFAKYHQARMVMGGLNVVSTYDPSDILVGAASNIFDSTGIDTVKLPIDPGDGDRVIGMSETFFRNLYVFKGPQFGSVHEISGNTTTSYTKNRITSGAPAVSNRAIITTPTDIYWLSRYGVHSLQTTLKYGDVEQGFLSLPIQNLWRKRLIVLEDLPNSAGFWDPLRSIVGWSVMPAGFTAGGIDTAAAPGARSWMIVYNYALSDPAPGGKKFWSIWKISRQTGADYGISAFARVVSPTGGYQPNHLGEVHTFLGSDNGMVYQIGYPFFEDDGAAYATQITTPIITRFRTEAGTVPETSEKQFTGIVSYYAAPDTQVLSGMNYSASVDNRDAGNGVLTGSRAGGVLGTMILGSGILGGISFIFEESIIEGRGRGLQLTWSNAVLDEDFEHHGFSVRFAAAESEAKEAS